MKKTYITPKMKVRTIQCSHMLSASLETLGGTSQGDRYNDPNYDYIGGESGDGYGYSSNPD